MMIDLLMVAGGLVLLVVAGDALVKGAVNLSLRLGVPALIVGLTVVAFGTSAPELLVSVDAVLNNAPALALGNVIGSNIANILLVLGIPALISVVPVSRELTHDFLVMMGAALLFIALAWVGPFGWMHGLALLAGLAAMLWNSYRRAQAHRASAEPDLEGADPSISGVKIALYLVGGLIGLPVGANLLVSGATSIATSLGVSEAVIGLTLVAVGTSLPELATTIAAAFRKEAGVAMGNVIGSNIFNLLGIIGIASLVGPLPVPEQMLNVDLWVMLAVSALLGIFVLTGRSIGKLAGVVLIALYGAYLVSLF